jgi:leader peptidase (prepilin peptidase) / N-methyltransferase
MLRVLIAAAAGTAVAPALWKTIRGYRQPPALIAVAGPVAGVFALLAWRVTAPLALLAACWVAALGIAAGLVDLAAHRLPDRFTLPAFTGALAILTVEALGSGRPGRLAGATLAGLAMAAFYAALVLINPAGMGAGDAKLALSLGTVLGWLGGPVAFLGTLAGLLLAAGYALTLLALGRIRRDDPLPHGPAMLFGALLAVLLPRSW